MKKEGAAYEVGESGKIVRQDNWKNIEFPEYKEKGRAFDTTFFRIKLTT